MRSRNYAMRVVGHPVDRVLLASIAMLAIGGLFIFLSASLGLLASQGASLSSVAFSQIVFGLCIGSASAYAVSVMPYRFFRTYALYLYIMTLVLTLCVFIPGLGLTLNGATRWIHIGSFTFQPAELLKIGYIVYLAAWLSQAKGRIGDMRYGLIPFIAITMLTGLALLVQPDTDTFLVIALAGGAMFVASGAKARDIAILVAIAVIGLTLLVSMRPYLAERFLTFIDPSRDPQGASYQIHQSLLAVGAGEITGRGFGQSIQKFGKLPEPISDSIFSVFAEEFGFVGSSVLVMLFLLFALRGYWVAARAPDLFGGLLAVGIVTWVIAQSYLNIAAMLGIVPLSGLPLIFISHGGTALLVALTAMGILLSVSRSVRT